MLSKEPDILSLPPIAGISNPNWAVNAPNNAAVGLPQRFGSFWRRSKYSWKVKRAFKGLAPTAASLDKLSTTA